MNRFFTQIAALNFLKEVSPLKLTTLLSAFSRNSFIFETSRDYLRRTSALLLPAISLRKLFMPNLNPQSMHFEGQGRRMADAFLSKRKTNRFWRSRKPLTVPAFTTFSILGGHSRLFTSQLATDKFLSLNSPRTKLNPSGAFLFTELFALDSTDTLQNYNSAFIDQKWQIDLLKNSSLNFFRNSYLLKIIPRELLHHSDTSPLTLFGLSSFQSRPLFDYHFYTKAGPSYKSGSQTMADHQEVVFRFFLIRALSLLIRAESSPSSSQKILQARLLRKKLLESPSFFCTPPFRTDTSSWLDLYRCAYLSDGIVQPKINFLPVHQKPLFEFSAAPFCATRAVPGGVGMSKFLEKTLVSLTLFLLKNGARGSCDGKSTNFFSRNSVHVSRRSVFSLANSKNVLPSRTKILPFQWRFIWISPRFYQVLNTISSVYCTLRMQNLSLDRYYLKLNLSYRGLTLQTLPFFFGGVLRLASTPSLQNKAFFCQQISGLAWLDRHSSSISVSSTKQTSLYLNRLVAWDSILTQFAAAPHKHYFTLLNASGVLQAKWKSRELRKLSTPEKIDFTDSQMIFDDAFFDRLSSNFLQNEALIISRDTNIESKGGLTGLHVAGRNLLSPLNLVAYESSTFFNEFNPLTLDYIHNSDQLTQFNDYWYLASSATHFNEVKYISINQTCPPRFTAAFFKKSIDFFLFTYV